MIKRGIVRLTATNGDYTNETTADIVEKTSGGYTEYLVRKTNCVTKEYSGDTLIGTYDEGAENVPTLYNHLALVDIYKVLVGGNYTVEWVSELSEV